MKRFLILITTLLVLMGTTQISYGADQQFEIGAAYQTGDYDLTYDSGDAAGYGPMTVDIPAPEVIWTVKQQIGNWSIIGLYGDSRMRRIDANSFIRNYFTDKHASEYDDMNGYRAHSRIWAVDLGYTFKFNKLTVIPTLGYHDTLMASGAKGYTTDDGSNSYTWEELWGYEVKGLHLGVDLNYALTSKIALKAGAGFDVASQYEETKDIVIRSPGKNRSTQTQTAYTPDSRMASYAAYRLDIIYQFAPHWAMDLGYRYESGSMETDAADYMLYPDNEYESSRLLLGLNCSIGNGNDTPSNVNDKLSDPSKGTDSGFAVGVAYQTGDYDLTYDTGNLFGYGPMKVDIPSPKVILTATKRIGNWSLTGSYGDSRLKLIDKNSYIEKLFGSRYVDEYLAHSRVCAVDLGYSFKFTKLTVTPKLGYHDTLLTAGYQGYDSYYFKSLMGYEIKGLYLGIEANYALTSKMLLKAGIGFGVSPEPKYIAESEYDNLGTDHAGKYELTPDSRSASYTNYQLELRYQLTPHWTANLGCRYESGSVQAGCIYSNMNPQNEYNSRRWLAGAGYRF